MSFKNSSMEVFSADTTDIVFQLIQLAYGIPSFYLMIFFSIFLGCSKKYINSFYRMVQFDLITNILCYINNWVALRMGVTPLGVIMLKGIQSALPGSLTWSYYLIRWFLHMQFWSAAGMGIHRIATVLYPHGEPSWRRYYMIYVICGIIYSSLPELILPGKTNYIELVNGVLTNFYNYQRGSDEMIPISIFSSVYFSILTAIGLGAAYVVMKHLKYATTKTDLVKKKLTRVAITNSLLYMGILAWSVTSTLNIKFKFIKSTILVNSPALTFASDMVTLSLPYILLTFDTNVRTDIVKRVRALLLIPPSRIIPQIPRTISNVHHMT